MRIDLKDFSKSPASHVVSLGPRCATAYNVRRHYDFGDAFPFDWWITNCKGLEYVLSNPDVDYLYSLDKLIMIESGDSIKHKDLEILFHHEFFRDWSLPNNPIKSGWEDNVDVPRKRTQYLMEKFLSLNKSGNRVFFIREVDNLGESLEIENRLIDLFPDAEWCLAEIPRVQSRVAGWKGDPVVWDKLLSAFNVNLSNSSLKPFSAISEPESESKKQEG